MPNFSFLNSRLSVYCEISNIDLQILENLDANFEKKISLSRIILS